MTGRDADASPVRMARTAAFGWVGFGSRASAPCVVEVTGGERWYLDPGREYMCQLGTVPLVEWRLKAVDYLAVDHPLECFAEKLGRPADEEIRLDLGHVTKIAVEDWNAR